MSQALVIAAFVAVFLGEGFAPAAAGPAALAWALLPFAVIWAAAHWRSRALLRRLDRTFDPRLLGRAERCVRIANVLALAWHGAAVFWLGEHDAWRSLVGDWVGLDELLCVAPPLVVGAAGFVTLFPIERRVREAQVLRALDTGAPMPRLPTRRAFIVAAVRQHVLFIAMPLALILVWHDAVLHAGAAWGFGQVLSTTLQIAGGAAVILLSPILLRRVLPTATLPPGPLRDRLVALGLAHRVRFREVLLWDTGGTQVNGAVMGLLAPVRYVLLSDALLERLDPLQVEAVMAHEVAHVRRHHMAWMAAAVIGAVGLIGTPTAWVVMWAGGPWAVQLELAAAVATLAGVLVVLGFVSRRFEWQADAFAAQHLSGWRRRGDAALITPEAAAAMAGALVRVGRLNGIHPAKFGFRHGSLAARQARLAAIVGRPADGLAIDREARAIKAASAVGLVLGLALVGVDALLLAAGL